MMTVGLWVFGPADHGRCLMVKRRMVSPRPGIPIMIAVQASTLALVEFPEYFTRKWERKL